MLQYRILTSIFLIWISIIISESLVYGGQTHFWGGKKQESTFATIGFRPSMRSGERSALRWLSKLMHEHPEVNSFMIKYMVPKGGKRVGLIIGYNRSQKTFARVELRWTPYKGDGNKNGWLTIEDDWWPIEAARVHEVAKQGGYAKSFGKRHVRTAWGS